MEEKETKKGILNTFKRFRFIGFLAGFVILASTAYITITGQTISQDGDGNVRPLTPQEAQTMANGIKELVNQSSEGLKQVQHSDGTVSVDLEGRFQNVAVAKKEADGSLSQSCINNKEEAAEFFGIDRKYFDAQSRSISNKKERNNSSRETKVIVINKEELK